MTTNPGTGILVFDTNPTCAKVYIHDKFYGTTEAFSLQIMNVNPGRYSYSLQLKGKHYDSNTFIESGKITHIYFNFNTNIIKEEYVYIGTTLTNFAKRELAQSVCPSQPSCSTQPSTPKEPEEPQKFKPPFDNDEPILKDTPIVISKHVDYYDISNTIITASSADPNDFDSAVYNRENIYLVKGRYSEKIIVKNDGFIPLFVIVAHGTSTTSFSKEVPIYSGEIKTYYNVYALRLRSSVAEHAYRVMEYDLQFAVEKSETPETLSSTSSIVGSSFDAALNMYEIQTIHIAGLVANKIKITAINGQSVQPLKYRLIFWSKSTANTTNIDTDMYVTDVVMDFTDILSTFQIDTGGGLVNQYYLDISGLDALYEDADSTVTLHMSLQNLSPVAKIAGANGAVQFDIKYVMKV